MLLEGASGHSIAVYEDSAFIFGGADNIDTIRDLYEINLGKLECIQIEPVDPKAFWPPPIEGHTAITDLAKKRLVVYGGIIKYKASSDIYEYLIAEKKWSKLKAEGPTPPPRHAHCAVVNNGSMIIYGGIGKDSEALSDIWELNLTSLVWSEIKVTAEKGSLVPQVMLYVYIYREEVDTQQLNTTTQCMFSEVEIPSVTS